MFMNKKFQATVAVVSAAATILINTVTAVAVPYGYSSIETVKKNAGSEYVPVDSLFSILNMGVTQVNSDMQEMAEAGDFAVYKEVSENVSIAYNTIKRANGSLQAGTSVTVSEGEEGEKTVNYRIKYENGVEVSREVVSESVIKNPVDKVIEYGIKSRAAVPKTAPAPAASAPAAPKEAPAETQTSADAGKLDYKYVIECTATAYSLSAEENGGYAGQTATGVPLDKGIIAVDPKVIPLGSRVYIEALDGSWTYGYALAADTGGAIKGNKVDLCFLTREECIQFGRRKCRVYILN